MSLETVTISAMALHGGMVCDLTSLELDLNAHKKTDYFYLQKRDH